MSLAKLTIYHETSRRTENVAAMGKITALFNPTQIAFENKVSWRLDQGALDSKTAEHRRLNLKLVEPSTFQVELFFDTYEGEPAPSLGLKGRLMLIKSPLALAPFSKPNAVSVLKFTKPIVDLTHYNKELHRPPICQLYWGKFSLFRGVLSNVTQHFTLFLEDGTPVRATMGCTFTEYQSPTEVRRGELNSADVAKRYTVRPGDTLINIAAEVYGDASLWRTIALANGIQNPRNLEPGRVLDIPPLS